MQGSSKKPRLDVETTQTKSAGQQSTPGTDNITRLSREYWLGDTTKPFDPKVIESIFNEDLKSKRVTRLMALEISLYLEKYVNQCVTGH